LPPFTPLHATPPTPPPISKRASSVESFKVMDVLQRANELQSQGRKILHCEVGQPESGAPTLVAAAAERGLRDRDVMGYTDAFGLFALRDKIAGHYRDKYSVEAGTERIVVTTGSSGGFLLGFLTCFDAGDVVAVASSGYPCYRNILGALGCQVSTVPINGEFKVTVRELEAEVERRKVAGEERIKGFIMSSPSNPTGAMLFPEELRLLCEFCDANGIQFISDEIYHGISYGTQEATALTYSNKAIVINSFSKYYSMSGWRLGWMIIPPALIQPINSLQQNMFISPPTLSQIAAIQCWEESTIEELEAHVQKYRASREIILEKLSTTTIDNQNIAPADGGFYVYVDLGEENTAPGLGSVALCSDLLEEEGVAFTPGIDFEDPSNGMGDRRFRISYAGGVETAREAMERFIGFWPSWQKKIKEARALK